MDPQTDIGLAAIIQSLVAVQNKSKTGQKGFAPAKEYVTKKTAAQVLDVSTRTIERYLASGLLTKHIRGANRVVLLKSEVLALVK